MKENILDVLMYLFENYLEDDEDNNSQELRFDQAFLQRVLTDAGFSSSEIEKAFGWLEHLSATAEEVGTQQANAMRVYLPQECERIDLECRGFLMFLERIGVLNPSARELVIDRVMELDVEDFNLEHLKWVILMVLFNHPHQESVNEWLEQMVFKDAGYFLH